MIKISIIIPTYKPKDYLWECLDAICRQTFPKEDFEALIVLNGCDEPYQTQIRCYVDEHPKIKWSLVKLDQGGVSNARNYAIEHSKGEFIAFIDDDDIISPTYLEELYACADVDTIPLSSTIAFNDGEPDKELPSEMTDVFRANVGRQRIPFTKARKFFAGPCMKLIHKSIIGTRRFNPNFQNGEDTLFMFSISDNIKFASFTSEKAIYYRRFRERSAVTKKRSLVNKFVNALKMMAEETRIYFGSFGRYNTSFYITRLLGAIRGAIHN